MTGCFSWFLVFAGVAVAVSPASAGVLDYIKGYQVGIDYASSVDRVEASYEVSGSSSRPKNCSFIDGGKLRCEVEMEAGRSSGLVGGWGIFLQNAFKRQGTFHFSWDVGFGARFLRGELSEAQIAAQQEAGLPLRSMSFSLAALLVKPYIQFGITPAHTWPDILISIGPAAQMLLGSVEVNDQTESAVMAATSSGFLNGFYELEVVFWRFGDGALSLFATNDIVSDDLGSRFFREEVDGMDNIRADFRRSTSGSFFGFGLKVLFDWP